METPQCPQGGSDQAQVTSQDAETYRGHGSELRAEHHRSDDQDRLVQQGADRRDLCR
jgi:hypothetical protein